jgi:hypothetical protein
MGDYADRVQREWDIYYRKLSDPRVFILSRATSIRRFAKALSRSLRNERPNGLETVISSPSPRKVAQCS